MPKLMTNHGNFVGSLGNVARYLGRQGRGARRRDLSRLRRRRGALDDEGRVVGIATGDMGIGRNGEPNADFTRGMELRGEVHGASRKARAARSPSSSSSASGSTSGRDHQKYGLGVKELWQVEPEKLRPGLVQHSMGWPLPNNAGGGSWLYHFDDNLVSVGFVVHLNYENPTLSPFDEFQRFKTHPMIRGVFEGGKRIGYGARAIMEGGWQSVPKLVIPGRLPRRGLGRLRERAAHQGQPQRDPVRHALRRAPRSTP